MLDEPTVASEISALDVAAVPKVVAYHELGGLPANPLTLGKLGKQRHFAGPKLHQLHQRPHPLHCLCDRRQQHAFHTDREIDTWRLVPRRVHIVDDVDATDEGDLAVDLT